MIPEGHRTDEHCVEIGLEERGEKLRAVVLEIELVEKARRHRGQSAQLEGSAGEQFDRRDRSNAIYRARQPFEDFAGTPVAVDRARRIMAFDLCEDFSCL